MGIAELKGQKGPPHKKVEIHQVSKLVILAEISKQSKFGFLSAEIWGKSTRNLAIEIYA